MITFATIWILGVLGTFLWISLTEILVMKLRSPSAILELQRRLKNKDPNTKGYLWIWDIFQIFLFWWFFLFYWGWAAIKGRSLLEHLVWRAEARTEAKAEAKALMAKALRMARRQLTEGTESKETLQEHFSQAGFQLDFEEFEDEQGKGLIWTVYKDDEIVGYNRAYHQEND